MRSPVLIAETPFANGHGPRFLAPSGRGVDRVTAARYVDLVRDEEDDVEEVEGDDYLAVRMSLNDEATGAAAAQILVLAGIDVNRMTSEERDEVLEQLRERLEVLNDAVAAIDWTVHGHNLVVEIPELEEWHEAGWDVLPRTGRWAEESRESSPAPFRGVDSDQTPNEETEPDEPAPSESEHESESVVEERVEDAGDPFHFGPTLAPDRDPLPEPVSATSAEPEPPAPEPDEPPRIELRDPAPEPVKSAVPATEVMVKTPEPPSSPPPEPPAKAPTARFDSSPTPTPGAIDPIQVSESVDRSPSLSPLPPRPADAPRSRPIALRWWVWGPWTAVAVLLTAKYLYLTQVDRTWDQRISEFHFAAGPTKVVEVPADRVVEKPVSSPAASGNKQEQWDRFAREFQQRMNRNEFVAAADDLHEWKTHLSMWADEEPPGLKGLRDEYHKTVEAKLGDSVAAVASEARFAHAYDAVAAIVSSTSVQAIVPAPALGDRVKAARAVIRQIEDQYHYTRIRALADKPADDAQLKQHIDAYLALVDPPGRMLAEVQKLADYRKWLHESQPAKAIVKVQWGPRAAGGSHTIEIGLGVGKDGRPFKTFTRIADAKRGSAWTETLPVAGIAGSAADIPYQIKMTRPASAIEELAEAVRERTESFVPNGPGPMTGTESGTVVGVEWQGIVDRPVLPAWKEVKAPVIPVSLPKVGP